MLEDQQVTQRLWRLFWTVVAVAAAIFVGARARADFMIGNELDAYCAPGSATQLYCDGYVAAIADVMKHSPVHGGMDCGPPEVTLQQMVDIVRRFLTAHPEDQHFSAESLVADAIAEAFPCRR